MNTMAERLKEALSKAEVEQNTEKKAEEKIQKKKRGIFSTTLGILALPFRGASFLWKKSKLLFLSGAAALYFWGSSGNSDQSVSGTYRPQSNKTPTSQLGKSFQRPGRITMKEMHVDDLSDMPSVSGLFGDTLIDPQDRGYGRHDHLNNNSSAMEKDEAQQGAATLAGHIRKVCYEAGTKAGNFDHVGNCLVIVQDQTNPKNFVNCHIGFRPGEGNAAGKHNIMAGYQTSRICEKGLESETWRKLAGVAFNLKMADDFVMRIRLKDDGFEGKMSLGNYDPNLPVYTVARRDGLLVLTADENLNLTPAKDGAQALATLALVKESNVEEGALGDQIYMRPTKGFSQKKTHSRYSSKMQNNGR